MAADGGLIALTFLLLAALLLLLYCLLRQIGTTKQCLRRVCAFLLALQPGGTSDRGVRGIGEEDEEEADYVDRVGGQTGGGLFWKTSEEERSILGNRAGGRAAANVAFQGTALNQPKGTFDSNSYTDYSSLAQQEQMATVTKIPPTVSNGMSASSKTCDQQRVKPSVPVAVNSTQADYTYTIRPPPPSPQTTPSPGTRRRRQMEQQTEMKPKKSIEKAPQGLDLATLAYTSPSPRPMTPDFRYTVLADDEDESHRKWVAPNHDSHKMAVANATNGNSFRSSSVDAGSSGQLDVSADPGRRHSLTSVPGGQSSPAASDNPSPSGSVSDLDPESLLVLEDSFSGLCSRRTSISSVDSNLERLDDNSAPSLMRALSSDSLDSTCSIMELSSSEPEIGQLETRLYYDSSNQYLHVWILQAYDIKPVTSSNSGGLVEYWVVVFLLPHQQPLYRTQLLPYAPVLQFHEQFRQRVRDQDLRKLALLCQIYCRIRPPHETQSVGAALAAAGAAPPLLPSSSSASNMTPTKRTGSLGGNDLVGQAKVRLKDVELSVANTLWLSLLPRLDSSDTDRHLGEILFSLSYLPTAERLTVVVAKARNVRTSDGIHPDKIMVRVYLVYGAKISKKKTSIKSTAEGSTSFNESIIFSLSQTLVQKVYLRLSVVEPTATKGAGDQRTIGHVTVGARRTGKEFGHWQKMTEQPRKPVSMWHHLSPKTQKLT